MKEFTMILSLLTTCILLLSGNASDITLSDREPDGVQACVRKSFNPSILWFYNLC
jgi:hypothetical protein